MNYKSMIYIEPIAGQKQYTFNFDFINTSFVRVRIGERELVYGIDYKVNLDKSITLTVEPEERFLVYRQTPTDSLLTWGDSSVLRSDDLNLYSLQLLHILEESSDRFVTRVEADGKYTQIKLIKWE